MSDAESKYFEKQLNESLQYGFIHNIKYQNNLYSPKVLTNNPETGEYVLNEIQSELKRSHIFYMNVAFVTTAGIGMLKTQLLDFAERGGMGKILVSPYLGFNDPKALRELLKLKNVEVRMTAEEVNSHAKMYIFEHEKEQSVIVGSSNLTHSALKLNYEWNVKLTSTDNGDFIKRTQNDFDSLWRKSIVLDDTTIQDYEKNRKQLVQTEVFQQISQDYPVIKPNHMQKDAVKSIQQLRNKGANRALVISATGTGKTYLGGFDVKQYKPGKMLFVVHREQILRDAQKSFQEVIGFEDKESIIYKSGDDITNKKYVFATVQSLSREENLKTLNSDLFDYILIDEVHHASATSYQRVMDHFTPDFYLGLTATPERTDGQNIYELFHYNVAYEIRLQDALAEEMLSPFLYYGVSDMRKEDGELIDEKEDFSNLVHSARVEHIIEKMNYYEVSAEETKGLIFCSRNNEAEELSVALNERGLKTVALSGSDSQDVREREVSLLEAGELDYILTVDIFNEGIDIPSINQIIMLRNTQSSIVFIQQLGRGLRLHPKKQFVTIIDFIGNYKNNYMIPMALYGDRSYNKENYKRKLGQHHQINGVTTINFEEIAHNQIFASIAETKLSSMANYKKEYLALKNRLGRIPLLYDYYREDSLDPIVFFEDSRFKHYGEIIHKFESDQEKYALADLKQASILQMIAFELLNGKRPHELLLLQLLIDNHYMISKEEYYEYLDHHQAKYSNQLIRSVERILTLEFFGMQSQNKYGYPLIEVHSDSYSLSDSFIKALQDTIFQELAFDAIETGLALSKSYPSGYEVKGMEIGKQYSGKDVLRLLLWKNDESGAIFGYRTKHGTGPIFINYHKAEDISETTKYNDTFVNKRVLHWYSKSSRTTSSNDVADIIHSNKTGTTLYLFVRRDKKTDFYYLGEMVYNENSAVDHPPGEVGNEKSIVSMDFNLKTPMSYNLYQYLVREN